MKIKLTLLLAVMSIMAFSATAFAGAITQTGGPGGAVTTANASAPGGILTFAPSPSVVMGGQSTQQAFAISAYHFGAVGKTDGKAFGMAHDATDVYWLDISTDATNAIINDTDSSTFNASWETF